MYKLIPEIEIELKKTEHKIFIAPPSNLEGEKCIITVGDICTLKINRQIRTPNLSIVDHKTHRSKLSLDEMNFMNKIGDNIHHVKNKAGTISKELWNTIKKVINIPNNTKIIVDGEEDLATLAVISLANTGTKVIYGMPDKGMVVVDVNQQEKKRANSFLKRILVK